MVAEEYFKKPVVQESNDHILQDLDHEAEETLSLCDLVEGSNWNNNDFSGSKEEHQYQNASSGDDQDFFEFFSEDFTASLASANYPKDNIIFCGKLIPYGEEAAARPEQTQKKQIKNKKNRIFHWKSKSMNMSRSTSSKAQQQRMRSHSYKALSRENGYQKYDFPVKEVSTLATSAKPRWYLLAFGYRRFPAEMKLRDIKNRQSRRAPATMFQSDDIGGDMVKRSGRRSPWKGIWTLLKILGCKSQQANAVVRASLDRIRHV